jgi:hypothetical protein
MADTSLASGVSSSDLGIDRLFAGPAADIRAEHIVLLSGQNLARGTLLGKIATAGASETHVGNTGNGVMTLDASTPVKANAKAGVYRATLITAAANGGVFRVEDPDGFVLGDVAVGATFDDDIKFVIADGATDFIVGDAFSVTVAPGSGKYVKSLAAATDGSQIPDCVLVHDTDASAGDKETVAYKGGWFNESRVTYGAGHTADSVREGLRVKGINLIKVLAA